MPNLTFLNPSALLGLVAISIPVLIHVLNRRRLRDVEFSSVVFLRKLTRDRMHRLNLKRLLLLVIRSLVIACVVLSFSKPVLVEDSAVAAGPGGRSPAVILLDRSFSMGYREGTSSAFELARSTASELLRVLDGRAILIPFDEGPEYDGEGPQELGTLEERLAGISISSRGTDVMAALNLSLALLRELDAGYGGRIYLITDMAAPGWDGKIDPELRPVLESSHIYVISVGGRGRRNVAVDSIHVGEGALLGGSLRVTARVSNYGERSAEGVMAYLYLGGRKVSQQVLRIGPHGRSYVTFEVPSPEGRLYGQVELSEDRLSIDNRRYFALDLPERIKVMLVSGDRRDSYFVREALASASGEGRAIDVSWRSPGELSSEAIAGSDVIFILNAPRLPDAALSSLLDGVRSGKGLFISLGPRSDIGFYNGRIIPAMSKGSIGPPSDAGGDGAYYPLGDVDLSHPILRGIVPKGSSVSWPRFYRFYRSKLPEAVPIMKYSNGMLALGELGLGRGKILLSTAPLDLSWSDLPLVGIFAPLILRATLYLAVDLGGVEGYIVGRKASGWLEGRIGNGIWCEDPLGERHGISPVWSSGGYAWEISEVDVQGIWKVFSGSSEVGMFAVNLDPRESDVRAVSEDRVGELLGKSRVTFIRAGGDISDELRRHRGGRELWRWFLLLAVALLLAEMYLARPGRPQ